LGYIVEIVSKAEKEFLRLPQVEQDKIRNKILSLENNPKPVGSKKLRETNYFRLRSGDYRVIYSVNDTAKIIKVLSIGNRKDVYK
jgi:mRNA interferase RelE/StbE